VAAADTAQYLVTCWASPSLSLRARENEFYKEASDALRQAVAKRDRLLDAARAGFLLSCYLYSKTRFSEVSCVRWTLAGALGPPPVTRPLTHAGGNDCIYDIQHCDHVWTAHYPRVPLDTDVHPPPRRPPILVHVPRTSQITD